MKFGLSNITISRLKETFASFNEIEEVIIFGSRATEKFKNTSDLDLAVKQNSEKSCDLWKIESAIDDLLLPYFVDILDIKTITNDLLVKEIEEKGKILYSKSTH